MTDNNEFLSSYYSSSSSSSEEEEEDTGDEDFVDAFPSRIYSERELPELLQLLVWSSSMESIKLSKADAIPVIPVKLNYATEDDDNRVYQRIAFVDLEQDRVLLADRFDRLYDNACVVQPRTGHEDVDWNHLDKKLLKDPRLGHRYFRQKTNKTDGQNRKGNADNRQSFVLRHMFLVKNDVTPGVKITGPAEYHLYQIHKVPLMIYKKVSGLPAADGSFYASTKADYRAFVMMPALTYFVGPSTTYITISLQKCCYAVLRVTESVYRYLRTRYSLQDAFQDFNALVPKSQAELEERTSRRPRRKRGRPNKSLDRLYWCGSENAGAAAKRGRRRESELPAEALAVSELCTAAAAAAREAEEEEAAAIEQFVDSTSVPELDRDFVRMIDSADICHFNQYVSAVENRPGAGAAAAAAAAVEWTDLTPSITTL